MVSKFNITRTLGQGTKVLLDEDAGKFIVTSARRWQEDVYKRQVVTFYSYFSMIPKGEHPISICVGTACYVRGAERVLEEFIKELDVYKRQVTTPIG